jgi:hypothetical protein
MIRRVIRRRALSFLLTAVLAALGPAQAAAAAPSAPTQAQVQTQTEAQAQAGAQTQAASTLQVGSQHLKRCAASTCSS